MRILAALLFAGLVLVGCMGSTPSDADQQKMAKDWSPENVAKEYEKKGMFKEAEEVRKGAQSDRQ